MTVMHRFALFVAILSGVCSVPGRAQGSVQARLHSMRARLDSLRGDWLAMFFKGSSAPGSLAALQVQVSFTGSIDSLRPTLNGTARWGIEPGDNAAMRLFGHTDDCVHPDANPLATAIHPDSIEISFTPDAADCGLAVVGVIRGDSFLGRWSEPQFVGNGAEGLFTMRRPR